MKFLKYPSFNVIFSDTPEYLVEERGAQSCIKGSIIRDKSECQKACNELGIELGTRRDDGKPCFKVGATGKCRQAGDAVLSNHYLICKNSGQ